MRKRIYKWDNTKSRKYKNCPYDFNFIKGFKTGLVIWWNERFFCIDLDKLKRKRMNE